MSVCHTSEPCKRGCIDRDAVWVEDSGGPKEPYIRWESISPMGRDNFEGGRGRPNVKYRDTLTLLPCDFFFYIETPDAGAAFALRTGTSSSTTLYSFDVFRAARHMRKANTSVGEFVPTPAYHIALLTTSAVHCSSKNINDNNSQTRTYTHTNPAAFLAQTERTT